MLDDANVDVSVDHENYGLNTHLGRADFRTQGQMPKQRPHRFCTQRYVDWIMGKNQKIQRGPGQKIAKVATRNRQNRHMAEFWERFKM